MCSYPELTKDHVLTSAYVYIFRTVTRNAVNKSVWRKKDCFWLPLNKHAMNIWFSSLRIRAHLSWRTGKHLHVLHVLRTCSTCSYPGYQDTTTYAALPGFVDYILHCTHREGRWVMGKSFSSRPLPTDGAATKMVPPKHPTRWCHQTTTKLVPPTFIT